MTYGQTNRDRVIRRLKRIRIQAAWISKHAQNHKIHTREWMFLSKCHKALNWSIEELRAVYDIKADEIRIDAPKKQTAPLSKSV